MATLAPTVAVGTPFSVSADLDGDGLSELIFTRGHPAAYMPNIYDGTQSGSVVIMSFAGGQPVDVTARFISGPQPSIICPSGLFVADYNGDGRKDIVVVDTGIDFDPWTGSQQHFLMSGPDGRLTNRDIGPLTYAHASATADIDNDGDLDLFMGGERPGNLSPYILVNDGHGNFTVDRDLLPSFVTNMPYTPGTNHTYAGSTFVDANKDGHQDLVLIQKFDTTASVLLLNDGTGSFANSTPIELPPGVYGPGSSANGNGKGTQNWTHAKVDLNRDGYEDLILSQEYMDLSAGVSYAGGRLQILINNKNNGYVDETAFRLVDDALPMTNGTNYFDPHVTDLNGDGWSDLVVTTITNSYIMGSRVFMNDGTGHLVQDKLFPSDLVLFPTDTDLDGKPELVRLDDVFIGPAPQGLGFFRPTLTTLNVAYGGAGNDYLVGWYSDDVMNGGASSDTLYGAGGKDRVEGGLGVDTVVFGGVRASYSIGQSGDGSIIVYGAEGTTTITGVESFQFADVILNATGIFNIGTSASDVLWGTNASERLSGSSGHDTIYGGAGNDTIYSGSGNDRIRGGTGKDYLKGESGNDYFTFDTKPSKSTNLDKIADYNVKYDTIWLDNAVFTKLGKSGSMTKPVKINKSYFAIGTKAKDKNDYVVYDNKKGVLFYDQDGSGTKYKQVEIATLSKNLKMTYSDFFAV